MNLNMAEMQTLQYDIGGDRFRPIYIGRGILDRLGECARPLNADRFFIVTDDNVAGAFLKPVQAELEKIWKDYGVFREIVKGNSAMGYVVNHTARVTLIDGDGKLRLSYGSGTTVEDIVNDLELLLK